MAMSSGRIRRPGLIAAATAFLGVIPICSRPAAAADDTGREKRPPNIIFILADDLGWTDVACYGSKYYETPNIDRLAAGGMRFTNGYTCAANCAPTRAAILTGQYGPRTGVYTVGGINRFDWQSRPLRPVDNVTSLPLEKVTVAHALKDAGYATAMFGKWHLGESGGFHPSKRGFDETILSAGRHFNFETDPKVEYPKGQYLADFLTDKAVDFVTRHKGEPFFLYLAHYGVHAPHHAKPELVERFRKKPIPAGAKPGESGHYDPTYAAMIYSVDESVGRVVKTLEELGLSDNTLVIFSSDNGGVGGYARAGVKKDNGITDNAPLRGGKGMFYDGGVRVPFVWNWPGRVKPGTVSDTPICSVDLYPTFLELAGAKGKDGYTLDGVSVASHLTSSGAAAVDRDAIYWHFPGYLGAGFNEWRSLPVGAVRSGDYKLMEFFEDGKLELYNLKDDPGQQHDLAASQPDVAKSLHGKLVAWRESVGAKMPTPNNDRRPPNKNQRRRGNADDE